MKLLTLSTLSILASSAPAFDLTPQFATRELEGFAIPVICFADAGRKVTYQPPEGWRVTGGEKELKLVPVSLADASVRMRLIPRTPAMGTLDAPEELKAWATTLLPRDSDKIALKGEVQCPFTLNGRPSHEYIFSYVLHGIAFSNSLVIVDLDEKQRLVFFASAREGDFKAVREEAITSMFSWQWE